MFVVRRRTRPRPPPFLFDTAAGLDTIPAGACRLGRNKCGIIKLVGLYPILEDVFAWLGILVALCAKTVLNCGMD